MSKLFNFRPLLVNPQLAAEIGLNEAIVLQQLKYWIVETDSGVDYEGARWVYNTHEQWTKQFPFWSVDTVKRALASLVKQGIVLVAKLSQDKRDQTNYYAINYLCAALMHEGNLPSSDQGNLPSSTGEACPDVHTEITTETTQEITKQSLSVSVGVVFDHWRLKMASPRSKLDSNRTRLITNALKNYTADDLVQAIDGCAASPFHMGINDQKTKYNGLDLILRNAEKIDSFIVKAISPPVACNSNSKHHDLAGKSYGGEDDDAVQIGGL